MKYLFVLAQLGASSCTSANVKQNAWHFANCAVLASVLFITSTENLRLCSSAEVGIVLKFYEKMSVVFL